jgi:hypothetical protein
MSPDVENLKCELITSREFASHGLQELLIRASDRSILQVGILNYERLPQYAQVRKSAVEQVHVAAAMYGRVGQTTSRRRTVHTRSGRNLPRRCLW